MSLTPDNKIFKMEPKTMTQKFGKLFDSQAEEQMAGALIQLIAEVAGYAVSEAVIQHQQGKPIRAAVEHGVVEFGQQMIARLKQLGDIEA